MTSAISSLSKRFQNEKLLFEKQSNSLSNMLSDYSNQKVLLDSYEYAKSNASFLLIQGQVQIDQRLKSIHKLVSQQQKTVIFINDLLKKIKNVNIKVAGTLNSNTNTINEKNETNHSNLFYKEQIAELAEGITDAFKEQMEINLKVVGIITEIYPISEERIIALLASILHNPMINEGQVKDLCDIITVLTGS